MKSPNKFLAAMGKLNEPEVSVTTEAEAVATPKIKPTGSRATQKHLGAYFEKGDPILERVAIMRARMDMTNSELIEHALSELWKKMEAERVFGN